MCNLKVMCLQWDFQDLLSRASSCDTEIRWSLALRGSLQPSSSIFRISAGGVPEDPSPFPTPSSPSSLLRQPLSRSKTGRAVARWVSSAVAFPWLWVVVCRLGWCLLALLGADDKIPGRGRLQVGLASGWVNHQLGLTVFCASFQRAAIVFTVCFHSPHSMLFHPFCLLVLNFWLKSSWRVGRVCAVGGDCAITRRGLQSCGLSPPHASTQDGDGSPPWLGSWWGRGQGTVQLFRSCNFTPSQYLVHFREVDREEGLLVTLPAVLCVWAGSQPCS